MVLTEDVRLVLIARLLVSTGKVHDIYKTFKVIEPFIDFQNYEEAAPISTFETAFHIILLEYS